MVYLMVFAILLILFSIAKFYFKWNLKSKFSKFNFSKLSQNYIADEISETSPQIKQNFNQQTRLDFNLIERLYFIKPALFELARKNNNIFLYDYEDKLKFYQLKKNIRGELVKLKEDFTKENLEKIIENLL